jgi:hypothetical protein
MKKSDIPQDESALANVTKEVCYAVDESGNYTKNLSTGWNVKADALELAWNDIDERVAQAKKKIQNGEVSPILYYMELKLMDMIILSSYTGFFQWTIKRHLKPNVFNSLSDKKLKIYADAFEVSIEKLKNIDLNES